MRPAAPKPSRAETVRQRRTQESIQRQSAVVTRVRRAAPVKEVHKPQKQTRRYQATSIAIPQARPQEHTLPQVRPGWRLLSGSLIALFAWALYMLWTSPLFQLNEAVVQGNQRIPVEEINAVLGLKGLPVFLAAPETLEQSLLAVFPDLASASVDVSLPATLTITITERQPVLAWVESGGMIWVDGEGMAFRPRGDVPGLTIVQAVGRPPSVQVEPNAIAAAAPFLPVELVQALQSMAPYVPAGTPILYDPQYGLGWNDTRGWLAYFGLRTDDLALKLRIYETLVNSLVQSGRRPVLVSIAYPNAPFYRLEP